MAKDSYCEISEHFVIPIPWSS